MPNSKIKLHTKSLVIVVLGLVIAAAFTTYSFSPAKASAQEPADINSDNKVDIFDLSTLLSKWNTSTASSDLNSDGTVNIFDLSMLLSKWGPVAVTDLSFPRIPWEGGSSYWTQFAKANAAGWDDPSFFPITTWLSKAAPEHVASFKDAGINTYMAVEHSPLEFPLTNITDQGLFVMPHQEEWTQAEVGNNPKAVSWFISDECEMGMGALCGGDQYQQLAQQQTWVNNVRALNDGRFVHANFGNGILRTFWSPDTMNQHVQLMDSSSADKYTYTSPDVADIIDGGHDAADWPNGVPVPRAYSYGWQVDQMKRFQNTNSQRPIWTYIETAMPLLGEPGARTITGDQMEGAIWSAIIHEARGISYFQHNNGTCGFYSIVECPDVHAKVKAVNAQITSLAPVLNTQSYYNTTRVVNGFTYYQFTFNNGTDTMLKTYNGSAYIFAGLGMRCNDTTCTSGTVDSTGSKTFTLPTGVNGTSVEVVGEGRTIPVTSRTFTDNFANEYSHHIYKITL